MVLRRENARRRNGAEDQQIVYEYELVDDGNARHGFGAKASHHHVIQKIYEVSDAHLDHNGHRNGKNAAIKRLVPDVCFDRHKTILVS